jgi:ABC-type lipopolysaccharide export system ATPase subunit
VRLKAQLLAEFLKERTLNSQPKILTLSEPLMVGVDMRLVLELNYLAVILAPQRMGVQTLLMLSSKDRNVGVMIRSGNLLSKKLLYPKLVVVNHRLWTLYDNPVTLISDDTVRSIRLHIAFRLALITRLALAYSPVTGD